MEYIEEELKKIVASGDVTPDAQGNIPLDLYIQI
jgi:hypothetical protein